MEKSVIKIKQGAVVSFDDNGVTVVSDGSVIKFPTGKYTFEVQEEPFKKRITTNAEEWKPHLITPDKTLKKKRTPQSTDSSDKGEVWDEPSEINWQYELREKRKYRISNKKRFELNLKEMQDRVRRIEEVHKV